jgi:protein tyrosine phosphatase (PTP) superfamily phosphohydrolase (DUF442 family)
LTLSICAVTAAADKEQLTIQRDMLGATPNVTRAGKTLFGGQPDQAALEEAQQRGIEVLVTFREQSEVDWDEAKKAKELGMKFHRFGFRSPESLNDELLSSARTLLVESQDEPRLVYCGSANRAGAIWMAHRALDGGLSMEEALEEGKTIGLRNKDYITVVKDYIERKRQSP